MNKEKFKLLEDLGGGGFARTYRAEVLDERLCKEWGEIVVIKIPHNKIKEKNLLKEAFKYDRLKDVDSKHIVSYLDIELYRGQYVLVLSHVDADSLEELLKKRKKLSANEAINIIEQCCYGLMAAEKLNILHRDIDPSNILICKDGGQVKLTDFGISEILRNTEQPYTVTGKYPYMAPEVFEGKPSFASDMYGLGVTFYRTLTGNLPFSDDDESVLIDKIINSDPIEPARLNKNIDEDLNRIILKAIARDKTKRYQNAQEFVNALLRYKENKDTASFIKSKLKESWNNFNNSNTNACETILKDLNRQFKQEPLTYLALGEFYNKLEQYDNAVRVFKKGIKKIGDNALLYKDLSISYMKKENFAEAINALERAISLGLEKGMQQQGLKLLKTLSSKTKKKQKQILILSVIHGPYKGHKFLFAGGPTIILGRIQQANVLLEDDELVSREHAIINYENGRFIIQDTNSTNGTFVNGERVYQKVLEDGDVTIIGNTHMNINIRTIEGYLMNKR